MKLHRDLLAALLSMSVALVACGPTRDVPGGETAEPDPEPDPDPQPQLDIATVLVTPPELAPALVSTPSRRAWLLIPAGGLRETTEVTIRPKALADLPGSVGVLDGVYAFGPARLRFSGPATLRLPLPDGATAAGAEHLELVRRVDGVWGPVEDAGLQVAGDSATALVHRLGTYGLRLVASPETDPEDELLSGPEPGELGQAA